MFKAIVYSESCHEFYFSEKTFFLLHACVAVETPSNISTMIFCHSNFCQQIKSAKMFVEDILAGDN